jgi:hypothetical protein
MAIAVSKCIRLKDGARLRMHFIVSEREFGKMTIRFVVQRGTTVKRYEGNSFHTEGQYIVLGRHAPNDPQHLGPTEIHVVHRFGPVAENLKDADTEQSAPDIDMQAPGLVSTSIH